MFVYFIQAGHSKGPIKIGVARNVETRLETMQTGNHLELTVITKIFCEGRRHALQLERDFHMRFKRMNIRGEWFSCHVLKQLNSEEEAERHRDLKHLLELQERGLL